MYNNNIIVSLHVHRLSTWNSTVGYKGGETGVGVGKLCQHNFEHNRCVQAFENYIMLAL